MPGTTLTESQKLLIAQLESLDILDNRYVDIKCQNAIEGEERRGVISLIFKAHDILEAKPVAIKTLDPERLQDDYRKAAFLREPEILRSVLGKQRCLNLISGIRDLPLKFDSQIGPIQGINAKYFVMEWIDSEIDDYFRQQENFSATEKLELFRKIALSVFAIHREDVQHRDIKIDNLRVREESGEVVLIDYGTAAQFTTPNISSPYAKPAGAPAYSAPEALSGLAHIRSIGKYTDFYALGCLLYELFNPDVFANIRAENEAFYQLVLMLQFKLSNVASDAERIQIWTRAVRDLKQAVYPPGIASRGGNSVPASLPTLLGRLHRSLTYFDFNDRVTDEAWILRQIDIAIRVLTNSRMEELARSRHRLYRENRIRKIRRQQEILLRYLSGD